MTMVRNQKRKNEEGKKPKICFVLESGHLAFDRNAERMGGQEVQFKVVPEELASWGYEVFILAKKQMEHKSITFLPVDSILSRLREMRPDLVITTIATKTALKTALACKLLGIDFVYWVPHDEESELRIGRGSRGNPVGRLLFITMLRRFTKVIIVQNNTQKKNMEERGFGRKLVLFRNAHPFKRREIDPKKKQVVLWVSRFVEWKQPGIFVEMARRLPHREFTMISPGMDDAFKASCRDVKNLRLIDFVPYADIPTYYKKARVFVNTSLFEGFPNAFQDAASEGTPIISMNVDPDGLFKIYGHGFLISDIGRMCDKIEELFRDEKAYLRACRNAYNYMSEAHDVRMTVGRLVEQILA